MSFLGELSKFILVRKNYWLLPVLIPILVSRGLLTSPKVGLKFFRGIASFCEALLRRWRGKRPGTWRIHAYPRHARRA
jgi:hypothetical protein